MNQQTRTWDTVVLSFRSGHSLTEFASVGRVERSIKTALHRTRLTEYQRQRDQVCTYFLGVHAVLRFPCL